MLYVSIKAKALLLPTNDSSEKYMPKWDVIINWNAVLAILGLSPEDLLNLPKGTREQAVAEVEAENGADVLFEKDPEDVDKLVAEHLQRILANKKYFQKREKEREKAKKEYANNLPHIEVFPMDEDFKKMIQDAIDNGQAGDLKDFFEDLFSKYSKKGNKPKSKDHKEDGEDEDPNRSMYI